MSDKINKLIENNDHFFVVIRWHS